MQSLPSLVARGRNGSNTSASKPCRRSSSAQCARDDLCVRSYVTKGYARAQGNSAATVPKDMGREEGLDGSQQASAKPSQRIRSRNSKPTPDRSTESNSGTCASRPPVPDASFATFTLQSTQRKSMPLNQRRRNLHHETKLGRRTQTYSDSNNTEQDSQWDHSRKRAVNTDGYWSA